MVPERSPYPDLTLGALCRLSCVTYLCLWTVSNVHSRLFCSVRRLGFFIVMGVCVTIFVNCAFLKCQFITTTTTTTTTTTAAAAAAAITKNKITFTCTHISSEARGATHC